MKIMQFSLNLFIFLYIGSFLNLNLTEGHTTTIQGMFDHLLRELKPFFNLTQRVLPLFISILKLFLWKLVDKGRRLSRRPKWLDWTFYFHFLGRNSFVWSRIIKSDLCLRLVSRHLGTWGNLHLLCFFGRRRSVSYIISKYDISFIRSVPGLAVINEQMTNLGFQPRIFLDQLYDISA